METLDETDRKILRILQKDAHLTVKELAARVNLSPSPAFERQKRLERLGYIERYMAVVNPQKVGNGILVLCNIRLKQHTQELIQQFMDAVQHIDEITECYNTSGDFDFLIKVYTRDMKAYQQFMLNTLGTIPCVGSLNSIFVIDQTKSTRGVPVPDVTKATCF
jgi:Lrp/AsnC family leucine-responsive transcriptional regulator